MGKQIVVRCPLDAYSGYGLFATSLCEFLRTNGFRIHLVPRFVRETYAALPPELKDLMARDAEVPLDLPELQICPPGDLILRRAETAVFTMWEASHIKHMWAEKLNRTRAVIVPCEWNRIGFVESGVTAPILKVPLGISPKIFSYRSPNNTGPCIFGSIANLEGGGFRKNITNIVSAFDAEFHSGEAVALHLKLLHSGDNFEVFDERINVVRDFCTTQALVEWFSNLTAYVSASAGEAWSFVCQEAMAIGRPVITPAYGGVLEYFTQQAGYPVDYTLAPSTGCYNDCGFWAEPSLASLRAQMRDVYENRRSCADKGIIASASASRFDISQSFEGLLNQLISLRFLQP